MNFAFTALDRDVRKNVQMEIRVSHGNLHLYIFSFCFHYRPVTTPIFLLSSYGCGALGERDLANKDCAPPKVSRRCSLLGRPFSTGKRSLLCLQSASAMLTLNANKSFCRFGGTSNDLQSLRYSSHVLTTHKSTK